MAQHPDLPNLGFPTSTIFTLGTDNGIILIRVHTEANNLHLFAAFVRRNDFTVRLHWTNWEPGTEETIINHNGIDVPVDSKEPIISQPSFPLTTTIPLVGLVSYSPFKA